MLLRLRDRLINSSHFSFALFHFLERLHCTVQCVLVVSPELGVCAFQGRISVCLRLLDAAGIVSKLFLNLIVRES